MRLEKQVCSLEPAKRLKELGVKQESLFYWWKHPADEDISKDYSVLSKDWGGIGASGHTYFSAFTVAELGEMLPENFDWPRKLGDGYWWETRHSGYRYLNTEADARAKMLIYLIEQGLGKP